MTFNLVNAQHYVFLDHLLFLWSNENTILVDHFFDFIFPISFNKLTKLDRCSMIDIYLFPFICLKKYMRIKNCIL